MIYSCHRYKVAAVGKWWFPSLLLSKSLFNLDRLVQPHGPFCFRLRMVAPALLCKGSMPSIAWHWCWLLFVLGILFNFVQLSVVRLISSVATNEPIQHHWEWCCAWDDAHPMDRSMQQEHLSSQFLAMLQLEIPDSASWNILPAAKELSCFFEKDVVVQSCCPK